MTCYQDVYKDFPARCMRLWERIDRMQAVQSEDLSVTAMLMVASAGFSMPWENLSPRGTSFDNANWRKHPSFTRTTERAYRLALNRLKNEFDRQIAYSNLTSNRGECLWHFSRCEHLEDVRNVGEYGEGDRYELKRTQIRFLLQCLRNAFAHMNICAFSDGDDQIAKLTFFSAIFDSEQGSRERRVIGWNVATTSVSGLRYFLKQWFRLIEGPSARAAMAEAAVRFEEVIPN